jgi:hypothetical protein
MKLRNQPYAAKWEQEEEKSDYLVGLYFSALLN